MVTILCIDGNNLMHRARSGFNKGDYAVCFNFFRQLRALVEQFKPNRVYFVTDGVPVKRRARYPEYKANRTVDEASPKITELRSFWRQRDLIDALLRSCFPVSVMWHPFHEADDVIYNLIKASSTAVPWIVVSSDSDFTQLLGRFEHVRVYNPISKTFVEKTPYDYAAWKALRGDGSDNIPGVPGIGDVKATQIVSNEAEFIKFCSGEVPSPEFEQWHRNYELIRFFDFSDQELDQLTCSQPTRGWEPLRQAFTDWSFKSLLKDGAWEKYVSTFDPLWG